MSTILSEIVKNNLPEDDLKELDPALNTIMGHVLKKVFKEAEREFEPELEPEDLKEFEPEDDLKELEPALNTMSVIMGHVLKNVFKEAEREFVSKKQNLYVVYPVNNDPTSINRKLLTTYLNRMIIDEEAQFEVKGIIDLDKISEDNETKSNPNHLEKLLLAAYLGVKETSVIDKGRNCLNMCSLLCFFGCANAMLNLFNRITGNWRRTDEDIDSFSSHFLIGGSATYFKKSFLKMISKVPSSMTLTEKNPSFTFISGFRSSIVNKEEIRKPHSRGSKFLRFWNTSQSSSAKGTVGDDIDLLFSQLQMGSLKKSQTSFKVHFPLTENEIEQYRSNSQAFLKTMRGKVTKDLSLLNELNENLYIECICTRETKI